jgi:uncharacterized protein YuzE
MPSLTEGLNLRREVFMKIKYYGDTDSLYIDLSEKTSAESLEVAPGIVVDFDENNNIVGIDIDHASKILNLSDLEIKSVPTKKLVLESPVQD